MALPVGCDFRCAIGDCVVIDFTADDDYDKGDVVVAEDGIGVLCEDVLDTEEVGAAVKVPLLEGPMAAVTIVAGEDAYVDDSAGNFTNVVASNRKCGFFTEDRADTCATAVLYFDGYGS